MRVVVQRVLNARVEIAGKKVGEIGQGLVAFVGITEGDTHKECDYMVDKLTQLRIFSDINDKMNLSLQEVKGELLIVSQFTLYGDCRKGRRPSFIEAARPETAIPLYQYFVSTARSRSIKKVATGEFGADMQVFLQNDGPVTLILDTNASSK